MPRWFGGKGGDGLPREWTGALEQLGQALDKQKRGLGSSARGYVLTGSPTSVLADVAGVHIYFGMFSPWGGKGRDDWTRTLFTHLAQLPPEVGLRLGRLVEAISSGSYTRGQPAHLRWAEALVVGLLDTTVSDTRASQVHIPVDITVLEAMSASAGRPPAEPLLAAFRSTNTPSYFRHGRFGLAIRSLDGYAAAVGRHAEALRPALAATKVDDRLVVLEMLAGLPSDVLVKFATELAEYATSTSSQVRAATYQPLAECGEAVVAPLRKIALGGKPEARLRAFELLDGHPAERSWVREKAAEDRAPSVRALAKVGTSQPDAEPVPEPVPVVEIPLIDWRTPVTRELRDLLDRIVAEANTAIDKANRSSRLAAERHAAKHGGKSWHRDSPRIGADWREAVLASLDSGKVPRRSHTDQARIAVLYLEPPLMRQLVGSGLGATGLAVLLNEANWLTHSREGLSDTAVKGFSLLHEATGSPSLLEVSTMLDQIGLDGGEAVLRAYANTWRPMGRDWSDEAVAPFMTLHLDKVLDLLRPARERDWSIDPMAAFPALASLPALPSTVADALFATALGSRKTERRPAQDALAKVPGIETRIISALSDGRSEVRALAAQWLARLRHEPAIPALEAAVGKEKQDVAVGAMLDALQAMGQPIEKYLDRDKLADQAAKAVAKGLPKDLAWFPWAGLPPVRWATGEPVPLVTLQWLLAQAVKAKSPEPNALLRKYCSMFDAADREPFGQFVLEAWIAEDLRPIDHEDARKQAVSAATHHYQAMQRWPDHYKDHPLRNASLDQVTAAFLPAYLRQPAGSAAASKGVLAVAAACAGERAAGVTHRYLKEWYGMRAAQGRALIVMLAWIDHPTATQLMLSVGSRFRTKSFQDEATRQAELLAERKGWTIGELADRTIPSAGLDENGVLELSYGERAFTARLLPDLSLELRAPDGARIKALPTPRQTDDADAAKAAKKALATAKKEPKAVAQLQAERLYEALCTERTWAFEDWQRYLNQHPVMRHLTQRLAWSATTEDGVTVFRPLDDGTLTDVEDEQVTVPDDARVAVAHDSNLGAAEVAAWQAHFADYEVTPLFQQFGKGTFQLPEGSGRQTQITDFEGHLVEAFALRGRAGKLGYTRGSTEDGGWFYTYDKRFPTLGITAQVEFSGNGLPEENRTVALKSLSFLPQSPHGPSSALRLSDVPSILLSEAWNDVRLMAADGSGFDPGWETKVEY
jgi:hypothetical protein